MSTHRPGIAPIEAHFGELPMQPKRQIAEYVATLGIAIPEIYPDIDAAFGSGESFVARSESPAELFCSGLTDSFTFAPDYSDRRGVNEDQLRRIDDALKDPNRTFNSIIAMGMTGRMGYIDAERWRSEAVGGGSYKREEADVFARDHSLSYWRKATGDNIFMVEDSGRPGRYYAGKINGVKELAVIEDGEISERHTIHPRYGEQTHNADKLVDFYTRIRNLPILDPANVPIVELVDPGEGKEPVFLQVLPTQQQEAPDFEVVEPTEHAFFVRGITPEEGTELTFWTRPFDYRDEPLSELCGGSFFEDRPVAEYYLPEMELFVPSGTGDESKATHRWRLFMAAIDHGARSLLTKPRITLGLDEDAAARLRDRHTGAFGGKKECFVQSDGNNVFLQYYDERERRIVTL